MFKTLVLPVFLLFFALTACGDGTATADVVGDEDPEEVMPVVSDTSAEPAASVDTSGKNFTLTVIDDKIKSPRMELTGEVGGVPVTINYGSPAVNDRVIYGDLVPYEKVWRTGANEATRITFAEDVLVGTDAKKLPAGTYSLFTLPSSRDEWTIIFNKTADQWGAYDYEQSADAARVGGTSRKANGKAERMEFAVENDSVMLMWDDLVVAFPVAKVSK